MSVERFDLLCNPTKSVRIQPYSYFKSYDSINYNLYVVILPAPCTLYFDVIPKMRKNNEKNHNIVKTQFRHWFKNKFDIAKNNFDFFKIQTLG